MTDRIVKPGERWATFIFDGVDCATLGVYVISNSGTYTTTLAPSFSDKKTTVTAYDGQYYYGTQITGQKFTVNMFAENLTYGELCKLKAWLNPRHIGKFILSDQPYKYYYVKPTSVGTLSSIPLSTVQTPANSILGDFLEGDPVYTGKFNITFETVGSAYGYGISYYRDDLIYDALHKYGMEVYPENYYYDSGLLYKDMSPSMKWSITHNGIYNAIPTYNPGDAKSYPKYILRVQEDLSENAAVFFVNNTTKESCSVSLANLKAGDIEIDFTGQSVKQGTKTYYGRMTGLPISITERDLVTTIPDTITADIEDIYKTEYDTIYVYDIKDEETEETYKVAQINEMAIKVSLDWIGRYFCINGNGGVKIKDVDTENNILVLEDSPITYNIPAAEKYKDGNVLKRAGFECRYIQINEDLAYVPKEPKVGDVYQYEGKWYMYRYGEWQETSLFYHEDNFRNIQGKFEPQYLLFGANILALDDIQIAGMNMPQFTLEAEILPRYL